MQIELSPEDRQLLVEVLERALSEARVEARHTADRAFREKVHQEEDRLRLLLGRLRELG